MDTVFHSTQQCAKAGRICPFTRSGDGVPVPFAGWIRSRHEGFQAARCVPRRVLIDMGRPKSGAGTGIARFVGSALAGSELAREAELEAVIARKSTRLNS